MKRMRIAGVQLSVKLEALEENIGKAEVRVREAAGKGAGIVCLPEYFATGFFAARKERRLFELAEAVAGPTVSRFAALAKELEIWAVVPFFERDARAEGLFYSSSAVVDPGGTVAGVYRKSYCMMTNGAYEQYYFAPGNTGPVVFHAGDLRFGICMSQDRHFFEIPRALALKGAGLIFVSASTPRVPGGIEVWRAQLIAMALNNAVYVMGVNSTGSRDGRDQFGRSTLVDPFGQIAAEIGEEEGVVTGDVSPELVEKSRLTYFLMRDLRRDVLEDLLQLYDGCK